MRDRAGLRGAANAASIAARGVEVTGVDVDAERLTAIASGAAPTAEEDVNDLVRTVVAAGMLRTAPAPQPADAFIIAVPTPHGPDHAPDVSFVRTAAESLAPLLRPGNLVVRRFRIGRAKTATCASRTARSGRSPGTCCTS